MSLIQRRPARRRGVADAATQREQTAPQDAPAGATTYYKRPMIKRPTWQWYIPLYFFLGGLAGGAALR